MARSIIEAAPIAMVMVDGEGRIALVNSLSERTFGYGRAELPGQPVEMLMPERYRAGHVGDRREYSAGPEPRAMGRGQDLFCRRKDGTEFPAEIGLNPVETAVGRYVLSSIVDMTKRKRQETLLREAKEKAEQATEVKSALLASMSHEIRTPLHGVLGMARILLETDLSEEQREFADVIRRSGERLLGIINDILDLSKIEAGRVTVEECGGGERGGNGGGGGAGGGRAGEPAGVAADAGAAGVRVGRGVERGRGDPTGGPGAVRRDPDGLAHAGDGRVGDDGGAAGAGAGAGARPTAIIAQTASAMAGGRERCSGEGMDDFLAKPLSMEALRAVSERWATVSLATDEIGH